MTAIPTLAPPCMFAPWSFTPAGHEQAYMQAATPQPLFTAPYYTAGAAYDPYSAQPESEADASWGPAPTMMQPWPYAPYYAGGAWSAQPGAEPQASWSPVSAGVSVTVSTSASGTVGPTVTADTGPSEPGPVKRRLRTGIGRRFRRPSEEEMAAAAVPTMLPAYCTAPAMMQPWPYAQYYTAGGAYSAQPGPAPQASFSPASVGPTVSVSRTGTGTHTGSVSVTIGPTLSADTQPEPGGRRRRDRKSVV